IFTAVQSGDFDQTQKLCEGISDINMKNSIGKTLLHIACTNGNLEMVKLFCGLGADLNLGNKRDQTPLYLACEAGNEAIVRFLCADPELININKSDVDGRCPLFVSIVKRN